MPGTAGDATHFCSNVQRVKERCQYPTNGVDELVGSGQRDEGSPIIVLPLNDSSCRVGGDICKIEEWSRSSGAVMPRITGDRWPLAITNELRKSSSRYIRSKRQRCYPDLLFAGVNRIDRGSPDNVCESRIACYIELIAVVCLCKNVMRVGWRRGPCRNG